MEISSLASVLLRLLPNENVWFLLGLGGGSSHLPPFILGNNVESNSFKMDMKVKVKSVCDPVGCSPPDFSVHGILQVRISREFSWPRDRTQVSRIAGRRFNLWATREAGQIYHQLSACLNQILLLRAGNALKVVGNLFFFSPLKAIPLFKMDLTENGETDLKADCQGESSFSSVWTGGSQRVTSLHSTSSATRWQGSL